MLSSLPRQLFYCMAAPHFPDTSSPKRSRHLYRSLAMLSLVTVFSCAHFFSQASTVAAPVRRTTITGLAPAILRATFQDSTFNVTNALPAQGLRDIILSTGATTGLESHTNTHTKLIQIELVRKSLQVPPRFFLRPDNLGMGPQRPDWSEPVVYVAVDIFICSSKFPGRGICFITSPRDRGVIPGGLDGIAISVPSVNVSRARLTGHLAITGDVFMGWLLVELPQSAPVYATLHCGNHDVTALLQQVAPPDPACDAAMATDLPCVALCTVFTPGALEGVAWLQYWASIGTAHIYLYLNVEASEADELTDLQLERVSELLSWAPNRITLILWPLPYHALPDGRESKGARKHFNAAQHLAQADVMARYGQRYSHVAFFDFDEYPVFIKRGDWDLPRWLASFPDSVGEIDLAMRPARTSRPSDAPDLGIIKGLDFFIRKAQVLSV
jgi:hypothetical protein